MALLTYEERKLLVTALIDSGLDILGNRNALLQDAVSPRLRGTMQDSRVPTAQLLQDIGNLIKFDRLATGVVPLEIYLQNAELLVAGDARALAVIRDLLSKVSQRARGAPRLDPAAMPEIKEKLIHGADDTVTFAFMEAGMRAAASVVKLLVPRYEQGSAREHMGAPLIYLGTGWLVAPTLVMTNHHVVNAREDGETAAQVDDLHAQAARTQMLYDVDFDNAAGTPLPVLRLEAWDEQLDYALLRVAATSRRPLPLATRRPVLHMPVNIIQHPRGRSKRFGIRNNLVSAIEEEKLRYFTDTDSGSSGAPVCNDAWEVVALHRGSVYVENVQFQGKATAYVNVGTTIDAIVQHLRSQHRSLADEIMPPR